MRLFALSLSLALLPACSFLPEDDEYYTGGSDTPNTSPLGCEPLPASSGSFVDVTTAQAGQLPALVATAAPGTTLRLAAGTYVVSEPLVFSQPGVTLRSATDDSASVTIDGQRNPQYLVRVTASDVTLAHLTLTRASETAVLLVPGPLATGFRMHATRIIDGGQEFLRAEGSAASGYVDSATITCSELQLTSELRGDVCCPSCVLLGLNVFGGRDWVLAGSRFQDLNCGGFPTPSAPPFAALFRGGARDALIENNAFWNPARGLGLGFDANDANQRVYPDAPHGGLSLDFVDGVVRNNVIFSSESSFDTGVEINDAREPRFLHNTVVHTNPGYRSVDWRYADTQVFVANNLAVTMGPRENATATTTTNLENTPLSYFVDASAFDLHLVPTASGAIDLGTELSDSGLDLDGDPHGPQPDIGADER
jgi:hypothetical protein